MINVSRESAMRAPSAHKFEVGKGYFYLGELPMPREPIGPASACEPPVDSIKGAIHLLNSPQNTEIRAGWDGLARVWMPIPNIGRRMAFSSAYLAAHGWTYIGLAK